MLSNFVKTVKKPDFFQTEEAQHVLDKHIGKPDKYLKDRCYKKDIAATFHNEQMARLAILATVLYYRKRVEDWLVSDSEEKMVLTANCKPGVSSGRAYSYYAGFLNLHAITVVLAKAPDTPNGLRVVTAYPSASKADEKRIDDVWKARHKS